MNRKLIEYYAKNYTKVQLYFKDNSTIVGYLVTDNYNEQAFKILPFDYRCYELSFYPTFVRRLRLWDNSLSISEKLADKIIKENRFGDIKYE